MRKPKQKTNVEFVKHLMEFSNYGALSQLFIIDALTKHAERIAGTPLEELRAAFGENAFISPDAWQGVAKEIKTAFDERSKT